MSGRGYAETSGMMRFMGFSVAQSEKRTASKIIFDYCLGSTQVPHLRQPDHPAAAEHEGAHDDARLDARRVLRQVHPRPGSGRRE